jgi:hypothetical protein
MTPAIGMGQEGAELIAEPQGAMARPLHGVDIEIGSSKEALLGKVVGDGEGHEFVGIVQFDKAFDLDVAAIDATRCAELDELGADRIDTQWEVGGIFHTAEAIVRHGQEGAIAIIEHGGETLDRLFVDEGYFWTIDRLITEQCTGGGAWGEGCRLSCPTFASERTSSCMLLMASSSRHRHASFLALALHVLQHLHQVSVELLDVC